MIPRHDPHLFSLGLIRLLFGQHRVDLALWDRQSAPRGENRLAHRRVGIGDKDVGGGLVRMFHGATNVACSFGTSPENFLVR
jgi:hypothetical protein